MTTAREEPRNSSGSTPVVLRQFICVDLDRTILRSTTFIATYIIPVLQTIARERAVDAAALEHHRQIIATLVRDMEESVGKSFDFLAVYNERVPAIERLTAAALAARALEVMGGEQMTAAVVDEILASGALEVLRHIDQLPETRWGIVTSGGVQTQSLKLAVLEQIVSRQLGLRFHAQIISTEHKTRDVDEVWRQSDGRFMVPEALVGGRDAVAEHVVVIDDKMKNLEADNKAGITTILVEQLDMPADGLERVSLRAASATLT